MMEISARNFLLFTSCVLFLAVIGSQAACTNQELDALFTCITPYNQQFFQVIGVDSSTCDRTRINDALCTSFSNIVTCVNGQNVSDTTCRPSAVGQLNPNIQIPCKVEDFEAVCTNAPAIDRGDNGSGSMVPSSTTPLILAAVLVAVASLGRR